MVSIDAVEKGMALYLDRELLPNLPHDGVKGFGIGVAATLAVKRCGNIIRGLTQNKVIQSMGLVSPDGAVDLDAIREACISNIPSTGLPLELPMGISLRLTDKDIDTMYRYIKEGC